MTPITIAIRAAWALRSRKSQKQNLAPCQIYFCSPWQKFGIVYRKMEAAARPEPIPEFWQRASVGSMVVLDHPTLRSWKPQSSLVLVAARKNRHGDWIAPVTVDVSDGKYGEFFNDAEARSGAS